MSNSDKPSGLKPVEHLNGNPWNGKARMYSIAVGYATAIFMGDPVKSGGSADATGKYPTVEQAAAGDLIRGVVIGVSDQPYIAVDQDNLHRAYSPASTAGYCLVVDDPNVVFEVQEDSDTNNIDADMVGLNIDLIIGSGNTNTGLSGVELDSSTSGAGADVQCRILGLVNREDNALGANAKWKVLINEHELKAAVAGV